LKAEIWVFSGQVLPKKTDQKEQKREKINLPISEGHPGIPPGHTYLDQSYPSTDFAKQKRLHYQFKFFEGVFTSNFNPTVDTYPAWKISYSPSIDSLCLIFPN
jgi:hypothetical protein